MNAKRLLKLADFLNVLPKEKFNYGVVVMGDDLPRKTFDCGSVACAMGWTPVVFPRLAKYVKHENGDVEIALCTSRYAQSYPEVAEELFDIPSHIAVGLFAAGNQHVVHEESLDFDASPKQVASLIRRFVKKNSPKKTARA